MFKKVRKKPLIVEAVRYDGNEEQIKHLLESARKRGKHLPYLNRLISAFDSKEKTIPTIDQPLLDPLSDRELEVLRLLPTNLTTPEIAGEMVIGVNTVRTHIKNIYSKLSVHKRSEAVRRAKELHLL